MKLHVGLPLFIVAVAFSVSAKPMYFGPRNFPGADAKLIENPYPRNCGLAIQRVYLADGRATVALLLSRTDSASTGCAPSPGWRAPIYPIDGKPNFDTAMATLAIPAPVPSPPQLAAAGRYNYPGLHVTLSSGLPSGLLDNLLDGPEPESWVLVVSGALLILLGRRSKH